MALPLATAQMTCGMSHGKKKAPKISAELRRSADIPDNNRAPAPVLDCARG